MRFPRKKIIPAQVFTFCGFILSFAVLLIFTPEPGTMPANHTILCLGDSYTIGESVLPAENFPNQTISLLRKDGYAFEDPEIVAKTGWTTDELQDAIDKHSFKDSYDFVTLLTGVNNQYRGRTVEDYRPGFESLLKQAIQFANGKADHVIVLSIPDWGVTPFAIHKSPEKIHSEIDMYNFICQAEAEHFNVGFIDITTAHREDAHNEEFLADDKLHPSALEYAKWANQLFNKIITEL